MVTAHCLIKNEENFIWYSVLSVINHIDKIMIWDTGSSDLTIKIVDALLKEYPKKITYKEVGNVNEKKYSEVRQHMLYETKSDWIMILDGDEIWYDQSLSDILYKISTIKNKETVVVETINLIGDIFHRQESRAGQYHFGAKKGHYALRFINKNIPGLHVNDYYGKEGYFDIDGKPIQNRDKENMLFVSVPYIHTTHLARSSKDRLVMQRPGKLKKELGIELPKDFYYPESFFLPRPKFVPNIWKNASLSYKIEALIQTPFKKIKRKL